ncbi:hypothetical protein LTR04_006909, partial [Oleoguttula sp. CCFEE 6159]
STMYVNMKGQAATASNDFKITQGYQSSTERTFPIAVLLDTTFEPPWTSPLTMSQVALGKVDV